MVKAYKLGKLTFTYESSVDDEAIFVSTERVKQSTIYSTMAERHLIKAGATPIEPEAEEEIESPVIKQGLGELRIDDGHCVSSHVYLEDRWKKWAEESTKRLNQLSQAINSHTKQLRESK